MPELRHAAPLTDTELLNRAHPRIDKDEPSRSELRTENLAPVPHLTWLTPPIDTDELMRQNFLMLRLDPVESRPLILAKSEVLKSFRILRVDPNVVKDITLTKPAILPIPLVLRVLPK
jgi:hypothetical protein